MKYRAEVDGLRAVAVLPVILFHAGFAAFNGGFVGVDVFFVISGYLITGILLAELENGNFSIATFYERRARRILPALTVVMVATMPLVWHLYLPEDRKEFFDSVAAVSMFMSNILFWRESGYFSTASELKPLLHTWSLAVEEQFYLLFPLFLLLAWRRGIMAVTVIIMVALVISLSVAHWGSYNKPEAAFYLAPTRAWELAVGSLVALYQRYGRSQHDTPGKTAQVLSMIGLGLIAYAIFRFDKTTPFPGLYALVPVLGTALVIQYATAQTTVGRMLRWPVLVGIGLVSYSAYLWHQPLFALLRYTRNGEPSVSALLGVSALALALAYLTWRIVEQPARRRGLLSAKTVFALAIGTTVSFLTIGLLGSLNSEHGFRTVYSRSPYVECRQTGDLCEFGDAQSERLVLLIGDSHAYHLSAALAERLGDKFRFAMIQCGSCFMGEDTTFDDIAWSQHALTEARERIRGFGEKDIFAIIRSQRWHGYGIRSDAEIGAAIRDGLTAFGVNYRKLIFVGSTAAIDRRCELLRHHGKGSSPDCLVDPKELEDNEKFAHVTRTLNLPASVLFAYPYEKLCDGTHCRVFEGDTILFHDDHHLTKDGAALVVEEIAKLLD